MDFILEKESFSAKVKRNFKKIFLSFFSLIACFLVLDSYYFTASIDGKTLLSDRVIRADFSGIIEGSGLVKSKSVDLFYSPFNSYVSKIMHREGDLVNSGDSILQIDDIEINKILKEYNNRILIEENLLKTKELQFKQDQLLKIKDKEKLKNKLERDHYDFQSSKKLFEIGAVSESQVLIKESEYKNSLIDIQFIDQSQDISSQLLEQEIKNLKLSINNLKEEYAFQLKRKRESTVIANQSGIISKMTLEIGEKVTSNSLIVQISRQNDFIIETQISQRSLHSLKLGLMAICRLPNLEFKGQVERISPDIKDGFILTEIRPNQTSYLHLRQNQRFQVLIEYSQKRNVLLVKKGAFISHSDPFVYVIKGNQATKRRVVYGDSNHEYIEIREGLNEGETIIISDLKDFLEHDKLMIN